MWSRVLYTGVEVRSMTAHVRWLGNHKVAIHANVQPRGVLATVLDVPPESKAGDRDNRLFSRYDINIVLALFLNNLA